jgi:hypothetical protein
MANTNKAGVTGELGEGLAGADVFMVLVRQTF